MVTGMPVSTLVSGSSSSSRRDMKGRAGESWGLVAGRAGLLRWEE